MAEAAGSGARGRRRGPELWPEVLGTRNGTRPTWLRASRSPSLCSKGCPAEFKCGGPLVPSVAPSVIPSVAPGVALGRGYVPAAALRWEPPPLGLGEGSRETSQSLPWWSSRNGSSREVGGSGSRVLKAGSVRPPGWLEPGEGAEGHGADEAVEPQGSSVSVWSWTRAPRRRGAVGFE